MSYTRIALLFANTPAEIEAFLAECAFTDDEALVLRDEIPDTHTGVIDGNGVTKGQARLLELRGARRLIVIAGCSDPYYADFLRKSTVAVVISGGCGNADKFDGGVFRRKPKTSIESFARYCVRMGFE